MYFNIYLLYLFIISIYFIYDMFISLLYTNIDYQTLKEHIKF